MSGLLYPAYQKFYSAISCLNRFCKEQDFFQNIASLDTFFSEYRSITLVMQKSLAHTQHINTYKDLVETGCLDPWLNAQRVKSVHTHPVEFSKKVDISIYFPNRGFDLLSESFTVENDVPLSALIGSIKEMFLKSNSTEVFFSAKCSFPEKDTGEDVLKKALAGIASMDAFMDKMYRSIGEECSLCNQLRDKISHSRILHIPLDFLTVDDYVYYPPKDEFERGGRLSGVIGGTMMSARVSLKGMDRIHSLRANDYFQKFVVMNVIIGTTDLMPTFMIVYRDGTFQLDTFHAGIKTTFYRKINEIANIIMLEDIQEVYYMMTYVLCGYSEESIMQSSKERLLKGKEEFLAFMKVDSELNEEEYYFASAVLKDKKLLGQQLLRGSNPKLDLGAINMMPIIEAFKKKVYSDDNNS